MIDETELTNLNDEQLKGRVDASGDIMLMIDDAFIKHAKECGIIENLRHDVCEYFRTCLKVFQERRRNNEANH